MRGFLKPDVAPSEKVVIFKSSKSRILIGGRFIDFDLFVFNEF